MKKIIKRGGKLRVSDGIPPTRIGFLHGAEPLDTGESGMKTGWLEVEVFPVEQG